MYEFSPVKQTSDVNYHTSQETGTSLSEYKISIYKQIKDFSKQSKKGNVVWLTISDECFTAMKQDPSYESWVLNKIQQAYNSSAPDGYDSWIFLKFGANKSDYKETVHSTPDRRTQKKLQEKEREERERIRKKRKKELEKKILEQKWHKQLIEKTYVQLKAIDHRIQVQEENKALLLGTEYNYKDHSASLYAAARRRASAYESTFLYRDKSF